MIFKEKVKGLSIGFLLGGALGSAAALLYARKPGKQLRDDIARKTNEVFEAGKKKVFDSWNGATEKTEGALNRVNDLGVGNERIVREKEVPNPR